MDRALTGYRKRGKKRRKEGARKYTGKREVVK